MRDYCYYCNIYRIFFIFILFCTLFCLSWIAFNKSIVVSFFRFSNFHELKTMKSKHVVHQNRCMCNVCNVYMYIEFSVTLFTNSKEILLLRKNLNKSIDDKTFLRPNIHFSSYFELNALYTTRISMLHVNLNALKHTTNGYVFRHFISWNAVFMHFEPI